MWKKDFLLVLLSSLIIIFVSFAFFGPKRNRVDTVQASNEPVYQENYMIEEQPMAPYYNEDPMMGY